MLRTLLKQLNDYKKKNNRYPLYVNITRKQYKKLKKELSIVDEITDDIKNLYLIDFRINKEEVNK